MRAQARMWERMRARSESSERWKHRPAVVSWGDAHTTSLAPTAAVTIILLAANASQLEAAISQLAVS